MKRVIVATDLHPAYVYLAPLTALAWRERVGYEPLVLCVGSDQDWFSSVGRYVRDALLEHHVDHVMVPVPDGYRSANVAQIARLYGWMMLDPDDYVLVSDVDMWPLLPAFFSEPAAGDLAILYANNRTRFPICYLGARGQVWQDIFGVAPTVGLARAVAEHMTTHLHPTTAAADAWQHDEEWITARVHDWSGYPHACHFVNRADGEPPADRLDRSAWGEYRPGIQVDAHLLRPVQEHWGRLRSLYGAIAPLALTWADRYIQEVM